MTPSLDVSSGRIINPDRPDDICEVPQGTILLSYRGSVAHNLFVPKNDPNSIDDIDLIGIVIGEPKHYLGLHEWGSRGTKEIKSGAFDVVYYEIKKAFSMLLAGNPNILSLLWTRLDHQIGSLTLWGVEIIRNRHLFVGKHVYDTFADYASAQLRKMESRDPAQLRDYIAVTNELKYRGAHPNHKGEIFPRPQGNAPLTTDNVIKMSGEEYNAYCTGTDVLLQKLRSFHKKGENLGRMGDKRKHLVLDHGYDAKNAAHCIRLLKMAKEFLSTGEMIVYREADREELLDIKKGKWPLAQIKEYAEQLFAEVKAARYTSSLPDVPDRARAEKLLISIIWESMYGTQGPPAKS